MSDDELKNKLTPEQYRVLRQGGTEAPGSGKYVEHYEDGTYHCAACGNELFDSTTKFESTMPGLVGWPAFDDIKNNDTVGLKEDKSLGMTRTEVVCARCGSHLGHYFDDPTSKTGKHYCVNSLSLDFKSQTSDTTH